MSPERIPDKEPVPGRVFELDRTAALLGVRLPAARSILPLEIADHAGRVEIFDPVEREMVRVPLERFLTGILGDIVGTAGSTLPGFLAADRVERALSGGVLEPGERAGVVVIDPFPPKRIPARPSDTSGPLKVFEHVMTTPGALVFFSSHTLYPRQHDRLRDYLLGWPAHVEFEHGMWRDRRSGALPARTGAPEPVRPMWGYLAVPYTCRAGREHAVHILTATEREDDGAGSAVNPTQARADRFNELAGFVRRGAGLSSPGVARQPGASEVIAVIVRQLHEVYRFERERIEPLHAFADRFDLEPALIDYFITEFVPADLRRDLRRFGATRRRAD